ncbi:ATP synthase subunit beta [bacterium AB1]|nr:ATP synthase subunit beta [bacterium AB1]
MYVISFNKSVVNVATQNIKLKIGNILKVDVINLLLEVKELTQNSAICLALGNTSKLSPMQEVKFQSKFYIAKFTKKHIGVAIDPLLNVIAGKPHNIETKNDDIIEVICDNKNIPCVSNISGKIQIINTGIKVIDFFCPYVYGGKTGIIGGAGVGKTTLLLEIVNNLKDSNNINTIFSGVGERIREGYDLYDDLTSSGLIDKSRPSESNIYIIFGNMDQPAAIRYLAAILSAQLANKLLSLNNNVLLIVDNVIRYVQAGNEISSALQATPSELGYQPNIHHEVAKLQELIYNNTNGYSITSIQAVYVPADDNSDPAVKAVTQHLTSVIMLNRELAAMGIYPPVDPLTSKSMAMNPLIVGKEHYETVQKAIKILVRNNELENIIKIIGVDNISDQDKIILHRAKLIMSFSKQPFYVSAKYLGIPGVYVNMEDTVEGYTKIVNGDLDNVDPEEISMIGALNK